MTGVSILLRAFLQIGISFYWASSCHAILISLGHFSFSASETGNVKKRTFVVTVVEFGLVPVCTRSRVGRRLYRLSYIYQQLCTCTNAVSFFFPFLVFLQIEGAALLFPSCFLKNNNFYRMNSPLLLSLASQHSIFLSFRHLAYLCLCLQLFNRQQRQPSTLGRKAKRKRTKSNERWPEDEGYTSWRNTSSC